MENILLDYRRKERVMYFKKVHVKTFNTIYFFKISLTFLEIRDYAKNFMLLN
jgi:hypothetical protein